MQWLRIRPPFAEDTRSVPGPGGSHTLRSNYARAPGPHALQQEKPPPPAAHALQLENTSRSSQLEQLKNEQQ